MIRAILLSVALAAPALAGTYTTTTGLEYARIGNDSLQLDLRIPDGNGPWPVIVYLHSGAWITGDRTGGPVVRQATRGYAVASIDYPLAPQYIWPSQIEACKAAVRWLRANAARFNLDPSRIGVYGTSAGGHLAAMLGTTANRPEFEGLELGNPQFSSAVKVVVDLYGPVELLKIDEQKLPCYGNLSANSPLMPPSLLMGCPIQECKDKTETSNPINYITPDDPPFLIMQGLLDCLTPWRQSQDLYNALVAKGVSARLVILPTAQHADKQFDDPQYQKIVDDFLDQNLRGRLVVRRRAVR